MRHFIKELHLKLVAVMLDMSVTLVIINFILILVFLYLRAFRRVLKILICFTIIPIQFTCFCLVIYTNTVKFQKFELRFFEMLPNSK